MQVVITIDTVTNEQLVKLTTDENADVRADAEHALRKRDRHWTRFQRNMQRGAISRCVAVLNARTTETK